jgi:basic membrane protein A
LYNSRVRRSVSFVSSLAVGLLLSAGCAQKEQSATATAPASAGSSGATGTFKVGLVTPGSISDKGWSESAYDGLQKIKTDLGAEVGQPVENDSASAFEGIFRNFAQQGDKLIFAQGSEYDDAAKKVAADTPDTVISVNGGRAVAPNLKPIQFDADQATYLAGMLAAGMSKTNKIGVIGPVEIPIIAQSFDAFTKGAHALKPSVEVKRAFIGSENVAKGKQLAESFLDSGVDVIMHNANEAGQGVAQAVMEKDGAMFLGANSDQSDLATPKNLGSFILDTSAAMQAVARDVKSGADLGKPYKGGLKDKAVDLVYNAKFAGAIPADLKAKIDAARADLIAGKIKAD